MNLVKRVGMNLMCLSASLVLGGGLLASPRGQNTMPPAADNSKTNQGDASSGAHDCRSAEGKPVRSGDQQEYSQLNYAGQDTLHVRAQCENHNAGWQGDLEGPCPFR